MRRTMCAARLKLGRLIFIVLREAKNTHLLEGLTLYGCSLRSHECARRMKKKEIVLTVSSID